MKIGHSGKAAILFGLGAMMFYLVMVLGTLRYLTDLAVLLPFDLRPTGYSQVDAAVLLEALGVAGRQYYLRRQIPLDTLYPALLALTLISTLRWRASRADVDDTDRRTIGYPDRDLRLSGKHRDRPDAARRGRPYAGTSHKHGDDCEIRPDDGCHPDSAPERGVRASLSGEARS